MIQVIIFLIRALLVAVLIAAGAAKLADIRSFATTLTGLGVSVHQENLIRGLATTIPLVEMGVGIVAVSGLWPSVINGAVLVLMGGFSVVIIIALRRHLRVTCRCFGALSDSQFSGKGLARSLFLTALAVIVFWSGNTYSLRFDGPPGAVMLLVAGYLVLAAATVQAAKTIAAIKERMPS